MTDKLFNVGTDVNRLSNFIKFELFNITLDIYSNQNIYTNIMYIYIDKITNIEHFKNNEITNINQPIYTKIQNNFIKELI